jgi:hypothetical protein
MLFSIRLDETGTDGQSSYVTVGGAVAEVPKWDDLEDAWAAKLAPRGIEYFHLVDFEARKGPYFGWSDTKRRLFENGLRGIIRHHTLFRSAVPVHSAAHASVKEKMRGIKGYRADSDYGLGLRYLLHHASDVLAKMDPDFKLDVMVERGPWTPGALATFNHMEKSRRLADRLGVFASWPKGKYHSLDAADLIAGREHERLTSGRQADERDATLAHLLTPEEMERFYLLMMEEKEARRAFGFNERAPTPKGSR